MWPAKNSCFVIFLKLLILSNTTIQCAKILGIFSFPGKSHSMMYNTIMKELALRGHEITMITNFPQKKKIGNYTEIVIEPTFDFWSAVKTELGTSNLFHINDFNFQSSLSMVYTIGYTTTEYTLQHPNVQELIHSNDRQFDLIIAEQFYQEPFLMLAHKFKAPVITVGSFGYAQYMSQMMGSFSPWSHVPHEFMPYEDKMVFLERVNNFLLGLYEAFTRKFVYMPKMQEMAEKYFASMSDSLPQLTDLERTISVILLNNYFPLTTPKPSVPGLVQVGGLHITEKPKDLPPKIKQFLDEAHDGAIYFSLGTNLRSSDMPAEQLKVFLNVFAGLKQRVLWKWEDDNISNLPKNVLVQEWMPQSDILAHKNVKVFITHGGLLSTQEGVFRAVPMLGIPIYCDQHLNMNKANKAGYAIRIDFGNITEESLNWSLNELIQNPSYSTKIREISQIFRDRPISALDEAIYWIEHVIRYKGANHIRSSAVDMSWFAYFSLDVITFLGFLVSVVVGTIVTLCKLLVGMTVNKKKSKNISIERKAK